MKHACLFSLSTGLLILGITGISAQVPKAGQPAQIKPGDPGKLPQVKAADPAKNPNPNANPPAKGADPAAVPPGNPAAVPPGNPPAIPIVAPAPAAKETNDFPREFEGKSLVMWINELKTSRDAAVREHAIRVFPAFGPKAMIAISEQMLTTLKTDPDLNVKLTALSIAPFMNYNQLEDRFCNDRLETIIRMLDAESVTVRYDATVALSNIGPVPAAVKGIPRLVARTNEISSWLTRKTAATALGSVGRGWSNPDNPAEKIDPSESAVLGLLNVLKTDPSVAVRREAANALIVIGPVSNNQHKVWKAGLENVLKFEKDRGIQGLVRVVLLKHDPAGVKGNESLLTAITTQLLAPEAAARSEACQALGLLGDAAGKKAQDLLDVITNPKEENSVVASAIIAVASMKSQAAVTAPVLRKVATSHRTEEVRAYATEAVKVLQGEEKKMAPPVVVPPVAPEKK
ncbi:HEAT repeat domain-containing protein [Zavarzinella formosa]|uniref:HEAT repeat domain-containing protein n=1 Tax=Zavarzinella formosa TaxID=360055 RepID=UPI0002F88EA6|nr:HEAT repeat domain-containing protein [Zavarzinella formosa]